MFIKNNTKKCIEIRLGHKGEFTPSIDVAILPKQEYETEIDWTCIEIVESPKIYKI